MKAWSRGVSSRGVDARFTSPAIFQKSCMFFTGSINSHYFHIIGDGCPQTPRGWLVKGSFPVQIQGMSHIGSSWTVRISLHSFGDKLINPILRVYRAPLKGFPIEGVMTIPSIGSLHLDHGTLHIYNISACTYNPIKKRYSSIGTALRDFFHQKCNWIVISSDHFFYQLQVLRWAPYQL